MKRNTTLFWASIVITCAGLLSITCTDWDLGDDAPDPVTLSILGVTDSSVALRWTQSNDVDFKCYQVYYSTGDIVDTSGKIVDTLYFNRDTVKTVTGLLGNTRYYFRVMVLTTINTMSPSNTAAAKTLPSDKDVQIIGKIDSVFEYRVALSWTSNLPDSGYNTYMIYYDTVQTVDSSDIAADTTNDTIHKTTIGNLQRNKHYWFKIYLNRKGKLLGQNKPVDAITRNGIPLPVKADTIHVYETRVLLKWSRCSADDTADFKRYIIFTDTLSAAADTNLLKDTATNDKRITVITSGKDSVTAEIKQLLRNKIHYITVFVMDTAGLISKTGNQLTLKTLSGIPAPVNFKDTALIKKNAGETIVLVKWNKCSAGDSSDFYSYVIFTDTLPAPPDTNIVKDTTTTDPKVTFVRYYRDTTSTTIQPLLRNKTYYMSLFVLDTTGFLSKPGFQLIVKTKDGFPAAVTMKKPKDITNSSVTILWTKDTVDKDLRRYVVVYNDSLPDTGFIRADSLKASDTSRYQMIERSPLDSASVIVAPLKNKTKYWFNVCVQDSTGFFRFSNTDTATTLNGIPEAVGCTLNVVNDSSARLTWGQCTSADLKEYRIYYDTSVTVSDTAIVDTNDKYLGPLDKNKKRDTLLTFKPLTRIFYKVYTVNEKYKNPGNLVMNYPVVIDTVVVLDTTGAGRKVQLRWTESYYKYQEKKFISYTVYRSNKPGITASQLPLSTPVSSIDNRYYTDTDFKSFQGDTAYYRIYHIAYNQSNGKEYTWSNEIKVHLKKPGY